MNRTSKTTVRQHQLQDGLDRCRTAYGAALLICPSFVARRFARISSDRCTRRVMRLLGARHLAQATIAARQSSLCTTATGATVDAVHATSMVILARVDPRHRRLGVIDAGVAGGLGTVGGSLSVVALARQGGNGFEADWQR